jgi:hypothetical protein
VVSFFLVLSIQSILEFHLKKKTRAFEWVTCEKIPQYSWCDSENTTNI